MTRQPEREERPSEDELLVERREPNRLDHLERMPIEQRVRAIGELVEAMENGL